MVEYRTRLDASNIIDIIKDYDVIVDGADNFPTRYLLNDASVRLRKPVVSASILGFDGQISTFVPYEGPCYRCLYPAPPPAELAPSCGAAGVLGVMAGVMGLLQANEVIKLVAGIGEPLIGRLLLYDSLGTRFTELKVSRDPELPDLRRRTPRRSPSPRWASSPTTSSSAAPRRASRRRARVALVSFPPMPTVKIPPVLRARTGGEAEVASTAARSARCSRRCAEQHPDTREQLFAAGRRAQPLRQRLPQRRGRAGARRARHGGRRTRDTVVILPAMAGGR